MTVDHIVPRSRGGVNEQSNYVLACNDCNSRFGNKLYKCDCSLCKTAIVQHLLMLNAIMHYSPEWAKILFELFERGTTLKRGYITPNRLAER